MLYKLVLRYMTVAVKGLMSMNITREKKIQMWDIYTKTWSLIWVNMLFLFIIPCFIMARLKHPVSEEFNAVLLVSLFLLALTTVIYGVRTGYFKSLQEEADAMTYEQHKARYKKMQLPCMLYYVMPLFVEVLICCVIEEWVLR